MLKEIIILFLASIVPAVLAQGDTTFLADFNQGYDADYAAGAPQAIFGMHLPENGASLVEDGKFGHALFLEREVGAFQFGYETKDNFRHEEGTVEFWFRPAWDLDYQGPERPQERWYSNFYLFHTLESPSGFRLRKSQYNWLAFHYDASYIQHANVAVGLNDKLLGKGEWMHLAASWDAHEGRLFINGQLVACSDEWEVTTPYEYRMYLAGWGSYDNLRISNRKLYISSFPTPTEPLPVEKRRPITPSEMSEDEIQKLKDDGAQFLADYRRGLDAAFAVGSPEFFSNRRELLSIDAENGLRLLRTGAAPEPTLCYQAADNLNQFTGSAKITFRLASGAALPAVLLDMSEIERRTPPRAHQRTGMRLMLNSDHTVEWQNLGWGRVVDSVATLPLDLSDKEWTTIGFSWRAPSIFIYQDGTVKAEKHETALPVKLAQYVFVGSDSQGLETLDAWIREVRIMLK